MGSTYRIVRPDGGIECTDIPQGSGNVESVTSGGRRSIESEPSSQANHKQGKYVELQRMLTEATNVYVRGGQ